VNGRKKGLIQFINFKINQSNKRNKIQEVKNSLFSKILKISQWYYPFNLLFIVIKRRTIATFIIF